MGLVVQSLVGVLVIPCLAYIISEERSKHHVPRLVLQVAGGIAAQAAIALVLLKLPQSRFLFAAIGGAVAALQGATEAGLRLVFGYLSGETPPFDAVRPLAGYILAFRALPLILVVSALSRLLYHWGVLQRVVAAIATVFRKGFGIGGPLGTVAAAKIFLGMVEAPLLVRPYLASMGRGALFAAMAVGMATIAGTVMALYAAVLEPVLPGAAGHILAASLMNAPGALVLARIAVPHGFADGPDVAAIKLENAPRSAMDAIAQGTFDGLRLLAAVVAMLIVMVALVALANSLIGALTAPLGLKLTLQQMLGWIAAPVAWLIGIPWGEAVLAGSFMGQKVILNELIAYLDLARVPADAMSARTRLILTYALCGFANLGSLGIMVGGLTTMVPESRDEIVELAPKAMLVGLMATLLSAAIVGAMTPG